MKCFYYLTICIMLCVCTTGCVTTSGVFGVARAITFGDEVAAIDTSSDLGRLLGLSATDKVIAVGLGNNCTVKDPLNKGIVSQSPFGRVETGEYGRFVVLFHVSDASGTFNRARLLGVIGPKGNLIDESIVNFSNEPSNPISSSAADRTHTRGPGFRNPASNDSQVFSSLAS